MVLATALSLSRGLTADPPACLGLESQVYANDARPGTTASIAAANIVRHELVVLMWRVADRDHEAFAQLYQRTRAKLFSIAMSVCRDRAAAEDVLADVYLTIWKNAGTYRAGLGSPIAWLAVVTRNRATDWWRRRVNVEPLSDAVIDTVPDPSPSSAERMMATEQIEALRRCLDQLPLVTRVAIQAAFFEGMTYAQLADQAGVPLGTMKSWIRRGLAAMKVALVEQQL